MMTDVYFQLITTYWVNHFAYLEQGGSIAGADKRKAKFLSTLKGYLPITALKYSDSPLSITFNDDDGGLISVTQISETDEPLFAVDIGKHTLLTVERFNGCWSALYAVKAES